MCISSLTQTTRFLFADLEKGIGKVKVKVRFEPSLKVSVPSDGEKKERNHERLINFLE